MARARAKGLKIQGPVPARFELSPDYHLVTMTCASQLFKRAEENGRSGELPADFPFLLEKMGDAVVALTTPSLVQPRFNDCFTIEATRAIGLIAPFFPARDDFAWIVSRRSAGRPPAGATASRFLPWSGFAAMRSGWDAEATYLCFDCGPLGKGHWHQDKLSFTLWKGGEELVFDDGGGPYDASAERRHALSGYAHNTLLVDGLAQNRTGPLRVAAAIDAEWSTTPERDRAVGVYDQGFGAKNVKSAVHRREIVFDKQADRVTVTDRMTSADGKDHDCTLLFQLDTTNTVVSADGRHLLAHYGRRWNLTLEVSEGRLEPVVARREPHLAGWFVGRNDLTVHPATTLFVHLPRGREQTLVTHLKPVLAP